MIDKTNYWFEKLMAVVFLLLLVGMIVFFNTVPLVSESKNVIMVILGVLLGVAKDSVPRIFGINDSENEKLKERIRELERKYENIIARHEELKTEYDKVMKLLIESYTEKQI